MFGSGSAPRTIAPGRPQGVQQTMLAFGVLRGIAVMPGVGFGYPCSTYVPEARPPTEAALLVFLGLDLLLLLLLHRGRPAGGGKVLFVLMFQAQPRLRHVD